MKTIIVTALLLTTALVAFTPTAAAHPEDPQCGVGVWRCDGVVGLVKDMVGGLDPRDWPCTCDPMPQPW